MVVLLATSGIVSQTPVAFVFAEDGDDGGGDGDGDGGGDGRWRDGGAVTVVAETTAEEVTKTVEARTAAEMITITIIAIAIAENQTPKAEMKAAKFKTLKSKSNHKSKKPMTKLKRRHQLKRSLPLTPVL